MGRDVHHVRHTELVAVLLGATGMSMPVAAHTYKPERELTIQLDDQGEAALWELSMGGPQAAVLFAAGDLDHNGELSEGERTVLAVSMLTKAVGGVSLTWDGEALTRAHLQPRLDGAGRVLTARGLTELKLEGQSVRCGAHVLRIRLEPRAALLGVDVRALGGWRVDGIAAGGLHEATLPVVLAPNEYLDVRVSETCAATPLEKP